MGKRGADMLEKMMSEDNKEPKKNSGGYPSVVYEPRMRMSVTKVDHGGFTVEWTAKNGKNRTANAADLDAVETIMDKFFGESDADAEDDASDKDDA